MDSSCKERDVVQIAHMERSRKLTVGTVCRRRIPWRMKCQQFNRRWAQQRIERRRRLFLQFARASAFAMALLGCPRSAGRCESLERRVVEIRDGPERRPVSALFRRPLTPSP